MHESPPASTPSAHARDRGGALLQYLALGTLAAVVLASLVTLGLGARLSAGVGTTVCRIVGASGDCGAMGGPSERSSGRPVAGEKKTGHKREDDGCHGFLGCLGHYTKVGGGAVAGVAKGVAGGAWSDLQAMYHLATNPSELVDGLAYAMRHPIEAGLSMIIDQEVKDAWARGDHADAVGRVLWNAGSMGIPVAGVSERLLKLAKLERAAEKTTKVAKGVEGAAKAGRQSRALQKAWKALKKARKSRTDTSPLGRSEAYRLGSGYRDLDAADRARFLDELSPQELRRLYDVNTGLRGDILAEASPEAVRRLDVPNPEFTNGGAWRPFKGELFRPGGPAVDDIIQGQLGNCWCMASMGAIAKKNPAMIKNMIRDNANGTYTVTFGDGRRVTVTSDLPEKGARVSEEAGWPAILEKAMAERLGGYDKIGEGDLADRALRMLTGKHTEAYSSTNMRDVDLLAMDFRNGDPMVVSLGGGVKLDNAAERGIVRGHSYAVVDVNQADRTVTLANPHGPTSKKIVLTENELRGTKGLSLFRAKTH